MKGKKIHITESQMKYIIRMIKEQTDINVQTKDLNNPSQVAQDINKEITDAKAAGMNISAGNKDKVGIHVQQNEGFLTTKKEIKEMKVHNMMDESKMYTKRQLMRNYRK